MFPQFNIVYDFSQSKCFVWFQPIEDICKAVTEVNDSRSQLPQILLHTDAAQAIGKVEVDVERLEVDYLTIVGHKFYAPRIGTVTVFEE